MYIVYSMCIVYSIQFIVYSVRRLQYCALYSIHQFIGYIIDYYKMCA